MKCHACGNELMENAKFCAKCGAKTVTAEPAPVPVSAPAAELGCDISKVWPEWELEKQLGRGSYGTVYQAVRKDSNLETRAAIKVISIPSDPSEIDSLRSEGLDMDGSKTFFHNIVNDFVSEIQLMESLKGIQNVVSVEDYKVVEKTDQIGWDIYIRMELLTPFNTYICDKALTEEEVIKLGTDICAALELCSQRNIIHRDIKPENLFVNDFGHFKLGDFGIARKLENVTGGLSQKGSPNYMAPEVASGNDYDARVDTYSLGIVLYRLLNGNRLPFLDTEKQILNPNERKAALDRRLRGEELPAPCNASAEMADIILRACAFDPSRRFSSASEMKKALSDASQGVYVLASVNALDKTTSVRKAPENLDKTTSVRKAPVATPKTSSDPVIDSFGKKIKRRRMMPKIIAAVVAFLLIAGVAFFFIKSYLDDQDAISAIIADADVLAADNDYEGAIDKIEGGLMEHEGSTDLQNKLEEFQQARDQQIATIIADADSQAASGNYKAAISKVENGLSKYPNDPNLQEKLQDYMADGKAAALSKAAEFATAGDYKAAMEEIQRAQKNYGDHAEYQEAYANYRQSHISSVKSSALTAAEQLVAANDYMGAIITLNDALYEVDDDEELTNKVAEYKTLYVESALSQANALIEKEDFSGAESVIQGVLRDLPANPILTAKLEEIKKFKPVSITSLDAINSENWKWNEGAPVDPFGNDYSSSCNYAILSNANYRDGHNIEYRVDNAYTKIKGMLAPYAAMGENGSVYIQILADDVLMYTSPIVGRKTDAFEFDVDVSGAEYIKIIAFVDWNSSIIISNVQLYTTPNDNPTTEEIPNSTEAENTDISVSITTLGIINSKNWIWNDGAPQDMCDSDYTTVCNYSILSNQNYRDGYNVEYRTDSKYTTLSGMFAPHTAMGEEGYAYIQVYADDVLVYTSPNVTKKTDLKNFDIDISGVKYIKIEVYVHWNSSIILSDITLE